MKVGLYASMFGKDDPPTLESVESYIDWAYALKVEVIDFLGGRGFASRDPEYLLGVKMQCLRHGLSIGYVATGGHFVGSDAELERKVAQARKDTDLAVFLGAPMIRVFCGQPLTDPDERQREIHCFQQVCDYAARQGVAVGLQNHPSTGDDILRILEQTERPNFTFILDTGQWVGSPAKNEGIADPDRDIYRFMQQTAPHAAHVRAKFYKIDSGREEWLDYRRIVDILQEAEFNGAVSVVFEGKKINACDDKEVLRLSVRHLRDLLSGHGTTP